MLIYCLAVDKLCVSEGGGVFFVAIGENCHSCDTITIQLQSDTSCTCSTQR